jgi:hypothetical protein
MVFKRAWTNGSDSILDTDLEEIGVEFDTKQPLDPDLTAIAALTPANDDVLQRKSGSWINRTIAQLKTDLAITINSLLPSQTSNAGKALQTDGANTFWGVVSGGGGGSVGEPWVYYVDDYGADPTGAAFSDTAVAAALTALGTQPGTIKFGVGTYRLNNTITLSRHSQDVQGVGVDATWFDWRGTGACIRAWDSTVPADGDTSPGTSGFFRGFTISGINNANTNLRGMMIGDLMRIRIEDVMITDMPTTGSIGFYGYHVRSWSERCFFRMGVQRCRTHVQFSTDPGHPMNLSSWMYSQFTFSLEMHTTNHHGIQIINNAQVSRCQMTVYGNATAATTNTGEVFRVSTGPSDNSGYVGFFDLAMECAGPAGSNAPIDFMMGASGGYFQAFGSIVFGNYGVGSFQAGNFAWDWIDFTGPVWAPSLSPGGRVNITKNGGTLFHQVLKTASYTLVATDLGQEVVITAAGGTTCTLPATGHPKGAVVKVKQGGAGQITFAGTIQSRGGRLKTAGQYAVAECIKETGSTWTLTGDVAV